MNSVRRTVLGVAVGAGGIAIVHFSLLSFRADLSRATPALFLVLPVVAAGVVARVPGALLTAIAAAMDYSFSWVPPYDRVSIARPEDAAALIVFLLVAVVVGALVAVEADQRDMAQRQTREIRSLVRERERLRAEADRVTLMQRIDEQRSALLRSVSHDLRTPLATIQAAASDLRDGTAYPRETQDQLLDLVSDEADRLNRLVENLLSLSRIENGSLQPDRQAVALDELVADRLQKLDRLFTGLTIDSDFAPDAPLVQADYSQLDQVVSNLLENAARHAPPGSTVRIRARVVGCMMEVTICDEGEGVPSDERESIFEPFHRGQGSASSGVGLAICRAIVDAHGGQIAVVDTTERGACLRFTVPLHLSGHA